MRPISTLDDALKKARDTRAVAIGAGVLTRTSAIFRTQFGERPALVVADAHTQRVAGKAVVADLAAAGVTLAEPFVFNEAGLYAEEGFVSQLETIFRSNVAIPVAVGSGTINDLVKLAAHRVKRPYLCVATAASMDGYTAFGASITFEGAKQTFACPAPAAVVADMDVIGAAPTAMTASGYADLLAKITSGADWIVADALEIEPIDRDGWSIVQDRLRSAVRNPAGVRLRQPDVVRDLTEGLLMAGFAMQAIQSSRAASGAEHQFSHLWDMQHHTHNGVAPSHGFKVGVGTVVSATLYEYMLAQPVEQLDAGVRCAMWPEWDSVAATIHHAFDDPLLAAKAMEEAEAKYVSREKLAQRLAGLKANWAGLRQQLRGQLLPAETMRRMLAAAGAPSEPEEIGITRARLRSSFYQAYFSRRRYTVLDLAVETGLLAGALESLFGPDGCWSVAVPGTRGANVAAVTPPFTA